MKNGSKNTVAYSTVKTTRGIGSLGLPKQPLPKGLYLVHNLGRLKDTDRKMCVGHDGFRAWVQRGKNNPQLVECKCKFGWLKNAEVHKKHYIPETWA